MPSEALQVQPAWLEGSPVRTGRYLVGPLLGQGGMGEVREAWDVVLRRTVALKVLRAMDPLSLIRFMHEAQLQARVVHPNVCRIYDVESSEGAPRIAMQLVRGQTLAELAPRLTMAEIIDLFARVADAVHFAHRLRLIHRDLKPSNILMESRPAGGWTPYVCDFGLAMAMEEPGLTYSQGVKGTPAYMAPEQLRGERNLVGPATDIYALGGTLYFALFGQVPFGLDSQALLGRRGRALALPYGPRSPLPRDLELILRKCLEPDPAQRYASMAVLAEEFRRVGRGEAIQTRHRSGWRRFLGATRARRRAVGLGLLAVLGLAAGLGQLNRRNQRQTEFARLFALEATDLERDLQMERMLPVHDLRPAYARVRARVAGIQDRMAALGTGAETPGREARGRARLLLGDYPGARADLESTRGERSPEAIYALAEAMVAADFQADSEGPGPDTARRLADLLQPSPGRPDPDDYARALLAFGQHDYLRAAAAAHASFIDHPGRLTAGTLEGLSFLALARQRDRAGDQAGAESAYRQALAALRSYLAMAQSDLGLRHLLLLAGRGLAELERQRGTQPLDALADLERQAALALTLDPDQPELQDDQLRVALLKADCLADLGRNPTPELSAALATLDGRGPLPPALDTDRTLLQSALASWRQHRQGLPIAGRPEPVGHATILF